MELAKALKLGKELLEVIKPYCEDAKIIGSTALGERNPRDIDIAYACHSQQQELGLLLALDKVITQKSLFPQWVFLYKGAIVDLFRQG